MLSLPSGLATLVSAALLGASPLPRIQLTYMRGPGADACPDEETLRSAVSAKLGTDPFVASSASAISANVTWQPPDLIAVVELSRDGSPVGRRQLTSPNADCSALADAMELAIAIAIDPLALTRPAAPKPIVAAREPPVSPHVPPRFSLGAGVVGSVGSAPNAAVGAVLASELNWPHFSVGIEGRADLPASAGVQGGDVESELLIATLSPCWRWRWLGACPWVSAGAEWVNGQGFQIDGERVNPYVALGGRLLGRWSLSARLAAELHLDLGAPLTRTTLYVNERPAWTTPPIEGSLGTRLLFDLNP